MGLPRRWCTMEFNIPKEVLAAGSLETCLLHTGNTVYRARWDSEGTASGRPRSWTANTLVFEQVSGGSPLPPQIAIRAAVSSAASTLSRSLACVARAIRSAAHLARPGERAQRLSPCNVVHRYARGALRGRGEGRALRRHNLSRKWEQKRAIRAGDKTRSASARRPSRSHGAANADQRQMTSAVEAVDLDDDRITRYRRSHGPAAPRTVNHVAIFVRGSKRGCSLAAGREQCTSLSVLSRNASCVAVLGVPVRLSITLSTHQHTGQRWEIAFAGNRLTGVGVCAAGHRRLGAATVGSCRRRPGSGD